ncbi:hypothetical protein ACOZ38_37800 [Sphaerisporangium viridialbum]|uniref:hypothetical protein n=1 Tax=Sphaerisporangium viridialbum TaxID=46189 RepID=UPI003C746CBA
MNDFDFLADAWGVAIRRLVKRLAGSDKFPGPVGHHPRLRRRAANFGEIIFPTKGYSGLTQLLLLPRIHRIIEFNISLSSPQNSSESLSGSP